MDWLINLGSESNLVTMRRRSKCSGRKEGGNEGKSYGKTSHGGMMERTSGAARDRERKRTMAANDIRRLHCILPRLRCPQVRIAYTSFLSYTHLYFLPFLDCFAASSP
jgi:hypothetical protein